MQMLVAGVVSSVDVGVGLGVGAGARIGAGVVVGAGAGACAGEHRPARPDPPEPRGETVCPASHRTLQHKHIHV